MRVPESMWAAIGALAAAVVLKVVEWLTNRGKEQVAARKDLREELADVWKRLDQLETEANQWRERYYKVLEENTLLRAEVQALRQQVESLRLRVVAQEA